MQHIIKNIKKIQEQTYINDYDFHNNSVYKDIYLLDCDWYKTHDILGYQDFFSHDRSLHIERIISNPENYDYSLFNFKTIRNDSLLGMAFDILPFYAEIFDYHVKKRIGLRHVQNREKYIKNKKTSINKLIVASAFMNNNFNVFILQDPDLITYTYFLSGNEITQKREVDAWVEFINDGKEWLFDNYYNIARGYSEDEVKQRRNELFAKLILLTRFGCSELVKKMFLLGNRDQICVFKGLKDLDINATQINEEIECLLGYDEFITDLSKLSDSERYRMIEKLLKHKLIPIYDVITEKVVNHTSKATRIPSDIALKLLRNYFVTFNSEYDPSSSYSEDYFNNHKPVNMLNPRVYSEYIETIIYTIFLNTPLRVDEVRELRVSNFQFKGKENILRTVVGKSNVQIEMKMTVYFTLIMKYHIENVIKKAHSTKYCNDPLIIPGYKCKGRMPIGTFKENLDVNSEVSTTYISDVVERMFRKIKNVPRRYTPHCFKHTFVSNLIDGILFYRYKQAAAFKSIIDINFPELYVKGNQIYSDLDFEGLPENIEEVRFSDRRRVLAAFNQGDLDKRIRDMYGIIDEIRKFIGHEDIKNTLYYYTKEHNILHIQDDLKTDIIYGNLRKG